MWPTHTITYQFPKEGDSDTRFERATLEGIVLSERSQTQQEKERVIPLYEVPEGVKFVETDSSAVGAGLRGGQNRELELDGDSFVWEDDGFWR